MRILSQLFKKHESPRRTQDEIDKDRKEAREGERRLELLKAEVRVLQRHEYKR